MKLFLINELGTGINFYILVYSLLRFNTIALYFCVLIYLIRQQSYVYLYFGIKSEPYSILYVLS